MFHNHLALLATVTMATHLRADDQKIPVGELPTINGTVKDKEWQGAATLAQGGYETRILLAKGRILCIAIKAGRGYRGERIDLHVADARGENYAIHAFHPACGIPGVERLVVAPVMTRHTSWKLRRDARMSPSLSCLFRARVLKSADDWSAEIAVDLAALDVSPLRPIMMRLDVTLPRARRTVTLLGGGAAPAEWTRIRAPWNAHAPALDIPEEDERRTFELDLFRELAARAGGRPPRIPLLAPALDKTMSKKRIAALLKRLDKCIAADPDDLFAALTKARILRRAHRFAKAKEALAAIRKRLPHLDPKRPPFAAEAFALTIAQGDLDAAVRFEGLHRDQMRQWQLLRAAWRRERTAREKDKERGDLPRVVFETAHGKIVVVLHEDAAPNATAHVIGLVESGALNGRAFHSVTGGLGGAVRARVPKAGTKTPERFAKLVGKTRQRAWRGTLALVPDKNKTGVGRDLLFTTGPAFLQQNLVAIGRVVEGQQHLDALEIGDSIRSAKVLSKRDHDYTVQYAAIPEPPGKTKSPKEEKPGKR